MRAAIYNPYWDTLGGGERYTTSLVKVLVDIGYKVNIEWKDKNLLEKLYNRFGFQLSNIDIVDSIERGRQYDVCFWISDGSIPLLYARKNILHFQIPFKLKSNVSLLNRMKFLRINSIVCNSEFTKRFIDQSYGIDSKVLYPPVDVKQMKVKRKENIILYVGRFSRLTQAKRQDILIESFKSLCDQGISNWKLVLAGGTEVGADNFVDELKKNSKNYPINLLESPNFKQLVDVYAKSKIFWSAAGYGIDEEKDPRSVEHFGMTVVEAMSSKCVPVIFNAGGHKEIIKNNESGFLWNTTSELIFKTKNLISNRELLTRISESAYKDSENYSYEAFKDNLLSIL